MGEVGIKVEVRRVQGIMLMIRLWEICRVTHLRGEIKCTKMDNDVRKLEKFKKKNEKNSLAIPATAILAIIEYSPPNILVFTFLQ